MRSLLPCLLVSLALAAPAEARIDPPPGVAPSQDLRSPDARDAAQSRQDLRSPDTRDAAVNVPVGTPPAHDPGGDAPWALIGALGLALPLGGGAAWAVRRRSVRVAA
jgi:hypothetical protein